MHILSDIPLQTKQTVIFTIKLQRLHKPIVRLLCGVCSPCAAKENWSPLGLSCFCCSLSPNGNSVGCLWHSHGKNPVSLYPKLQSQPIGLRKILSIISSSKPTNQIAQNLYRFLIDLLPLKNVEMRTFLSNLSR